jgi:hypothetical protein
VRHRTMLVHGNWVTVELNSSVVSERRERGEAESRNNTMRELDAHYIRSLIIQGLACNFVRVVQERQIYDYTL